MEDAGMAAYLKDVQGNAADLTAQQIIRDKQQKTELFDKPVNPNQMPEASIETNPRHKSSQNLPADVDFCDPTTFHRARIPHHPRHVHESNNKNENKAQGKGKTNKEKRKGKKSQEDDNLNKKTIRKLWYEAKSPEGYTYYWHIETNETSWTIPEEGFMTFAEQEEEAKEQIIQEQFLEQIAAEEAKEKVEKLEEQRANAERENFKKIRLQQEQQASNKESETETVEEVPYRRDYSIPDKIDPYGPWQTIEIKPEKKINLQLPQAKVIQVVKPETSQPFVPQRTFQEKTITRVSTGDSSDDEGALTKFKKRKFGNKNVRKRLDDD